MKSHPTSCQKRIFHSVTGIIFLGILIGLAGCALPQQRQKSTTGLSASSNEEEVSLKGDLSERESLRKDIPEEIRIENDEKAIILNMMVEEKDSPETVQNRFNNWQNRRRRDERRATERARDEFRRAEKKKRDTFLAEQKEKRDEFTAKRKGRKYDKEEVDQFYKDQDLKRKDFFADEREKRQDFESDARQKSNDFNAKMRDTQSEFTQEFRVYSQKWRDKANKKDEERKKTLDLLNKPTNN